MSLAPSIPLLRPATYGLDASHPLFSVEKYQRMIEKDILDENDKVELLENYLVLKMPRNPEHDGTIDIVREALERLIPKGWKLRCPQAVTLPDSQPEPDFAVVRGNSRTYLSKHPGPRDIGLVIEIANASLARDVTDKARIYANAKVACYWVINLVDRSCEVFTKPLGSLPIPSYAKREVLTEGKSVSLLLDGRVIATIPVSQLLP